MCSSVSGQALSMISSARAVASRDHSKSAQVASPEGRRGLPVPAGANVGQPPDQARAPVLLLAHEGEVREVSFLRPGGRCSRWGPRARAAGSR